MSRHSSGRGNSESGGGSRGSPNRKQTQNPHESEYLMVPDTGVGELPEESYTSHDYQTWASGVVADMYINDPNQRSGSLAASSYFDGSFPGSPSPHTYYDASPGTSSLITENYGNHPLQNPTPYTASSITDSDQFSPTAVPIIGSVTSQTQERRRQQNRAAQRAYRERKESYITYLESQLTQQQAKYNTLLNAVRSLGSDIERLVALHIDDAQGPGSYEHNGESESETKGGSVSGLT